MPRYSVAVSVVWMLAAPASVVCADEAETRRDTIQAILDHSGLTAAIQQVPLFIQAGMTDSLRQQHPEMSRDDLAAIQDLLSRSFAADVILQDTVAHMETHYDPQRATKVLDHLRSPLARKMTSLERASGTPDAYQAMMAYAAQLEVSPPPEDRVAVLSELDRASHATELTVTMQLEIFKSVVRVVNAYAAEQGGEFLGGDELDTAIEKMRDGVWEEAQGTTLLSFLFTYQGVSDAELRNYIRLHNDPDMQWYLALSASALINALSHAMSNATHGIMRHMKGAERQS